MQDLAGLLKRIIDREGPGYPVREPMAVFEEVLREKAADRKTAAALLHTLVMDIPGAAQKKEMPAEELSRCIQRECGFKKSLADRMAQLYAGVYSGENESAWTDKKNEGLRSFLEKEWDFSWKGSTCWDGGEVTVDCWYTADFTVRPKPEEFGDPELDAMLKKNPFLDEKAIADYFRESVCSFLDREFEEYCTCDDYYEPCAEDFEAESYLEDWCDKYGFELAHFEGDGATGDYAPKFRHHW